MSKWMVDQELVLHVAVGVEVTADSKEEAIALVEEKMPNENFNPASAYSWKAAIAIDKPKGVYVRKVVSYQTASGPGQTKARRIGG